jgi:imidazole glycerol-phosphate synthase subunit HisF
MKGLSVDYPMYFGATSKIFKMAKELRKTETKAEKLLWSRLRKNQILGLQFRRQHPINLFVADFYCPKIKLIVEVDGNIHEIPEYQAHDIGRSDILNDFGITVIRFTNEQITDEIDSIVDKIKIISEKLMLEVKKSPPYGGLGGR